MKNKKLLSMVVASALVATMAMPVMAADGGTVDVDFTTKTPVIRVKVPTSILAAVDPLEMSTTGTQIHSDDFTLTNMSEVPVRIDVKSVVDLKTGVTLVDTKKKAVDSTDKTKSDAWLAVAAKFNASAYADTGKTIADLTETDKNVATFKTVTGDSGTESSASQTFYLDKAASGTAAYKIAAPVATPTGTQKTAAQYKETLTYAQVHKLEVLPVTNGASDVLDALKTKDVYWGTSDGDTDPLTLIPAGTKTLEGGNAFASSNKYFTASTKNALTVADTDPDKLADGQKYVYGEGGTGGATAFRYIGKLGKGKNSWSDEDIDKMHINYSIYGLTGDDYTTANKLNGLYLAGPQLSATAAGLFTISGLSADCKFKSLTATYQGAANEMNSDRGTWSPSTPTASSTGTFTFQLGDGWMTALAGQSTTVTLTYTEGGTDKTVTATVTIQE